MKIRMHPELMADMEKMDPEEHSAILKLFASFQEAADFAEAQVTAGLITKDERRAVFEKELSRLTGGGTISPVDPLDLNDDEREEIERRLLDGHTEH